MRNAGCGMRNEKTWRMSVIDPSDVIGASRVIGALRVRGLCCHCEEQSDDAISHEGLPTVVPKVNDRQSQ